VELKNMHLENKILKILKEADQPISGEKLAKIINVSRVAIWKCIQKLKSRGYTIETSKKGYFLEDKDFFLEDELNQILSSLILFDEIHYLPETGSTMDLAKELAEKKKRALVIAERQLSGRGRLSRTWESEKGGLWLTLVLQEPLPLKEAYLLTYLSSVSVAKAIQETYGLQAKVKWPNDVLIQRRKVAGILLEIKAEIDALSYALIGIGINVNNSVKEKSFLIPGISISEALGKKVKRLPLLKDLLHHFEKLFSKKNEILTEWKALSETLKSHVKVKTPEGTFIGLALDIDAEGALLLELEDHSLKRIFSGDCIHLRNN
jgi:BirA family biotin operon repressor/biotin-[acetyl-CoA-carboxylase] ligase